MPGPMAAMGPLRRPRRMRPANESRAPGRAQAVCVIVAGGDPIAPTRHFRWRAHPLDSADCPDLETVLAESGRRTWPRREQAKDDARRTLARLGLLGRPDWRIRWIYDD